jgi:hypothetical protein
LYPELEVARQYETSVYVHQLKQNHISEDIVIVIIIIIFIIIPVTTSNLMRSNTLSEKLKLKY